MDELNRFGISFRKKIYFFLMCILIIPHLLAFCFSKEKVRIAIDARRWLGEKSGRIYLDISYLLIFMPEFRNLFYLRIGKQSFWLRYLPQLSSLYICVANKNFGEGTIIQHGFATVITAERIGKNCWINQQVTIGYNDSRTQGYGRPIIGNNVRISAGAKVVGPITVGDNSVIGVNAVITKNVPPNSIVVPSPMRYIYKNKIRVDEKF